MPGCGGVGVVMPFAGAVVVGDLVVSDDDLMVVGGGTEVVTGGAVVEDRVVAEPREEGFWDWEDVVVARSSVPAPITQYSLLVSRPGQVTPGFHFMKSVTDSPQPAAKLSQVASLLGGLSENWH